MLLSAAADDTIFQTRIGAFLQALALLGWTIGRNWAVARRRTVEETWTIDIGTLRRAGYVGEPAPNWWKSGDKLCVLGFWPKTWRDGWIHQTLWTEEVPWRFGGQRFYFRCDCGRRVEKLHSSARGRPWRCRHCYDLTYVTRQASVRDRYRIKTQKIRERLGGSVYFADEFPAKPKGMHWKRYSRLWEQHEDAKNYWGAMMAAWVLDLGAKIDAKRTQKE